MYCDEDEVVWIVNDLLYGFGGVVWVGSDECVMCVVCCICIG